MNVFSCMQRRPIGVIGSSKPDGRSYLHLLAKYYIVEGQGARKWLIRCCCSCMVAHCFSSKSIKKRGNTNSRVCWLSCSSFRGLPSGRYWRFIQKEQGIHVWKQARLISLVL